MFELSAQSSHGIPGLQNISSMLCAPLWTTIRMQRFEVLIIAMASLRGHHLILGLLMIELNKLMICYEERVSIDFYV